MGGPRGPEGPAKQPPRPVDTSVIELPKIKITVKGTTDRGEPAPTTPTVARGYQTKGKDLGHVVEGSRGPDGSVERPAVPPVQPGDAVPGTEMRKIVVGKYPPFSGYLVTNDTVAGKSHLNFVFGGYVQVRLPEGQTVYVPRDNLSFFRGHLAQNAVDVWPHEPANPTSMAYGVDGDNIQNRTAQKPQPSRDGVITSKKPITPKSAGK